MSLSRKETGAGAGSLDSDEKSTLHHGNSNNDGADKQKSVAKERGFFGRRKAKRPELNEKQDDTPDDEGAQSKTVATAVEVFPPVGFMELFRCVATVPFVHVSHRLADSQPGRNGPATCLHSLLLSLQVPPR